MTIPPPPSAPAVAPPPPPGGGKKPWIKWVALGCGALLVAVVAFAAFMFFVVQKATAGPETAVQAFLAAAGAGDYETAHGYFSAPLQEAQPLEEFAAAAAGQASLFQVKETTFSERSVDLAGAKLSGTLTLESGTKMPASFQLVKENGQWRLINYHIGAEADNE